MLVNALYIYTASSKRHHTSELSPPIILRLNVIKFTLITKKIIACVHIIIDIIESTGSVTGILVRGILVRGTKIFSGKLVRPDRFFPEKWSASGKLVRRMVRP